MTIPERHDRAVAFCCDRNYLHLALFMIRQIDFHNPNREFDFVISSRETFDLPDWAKPLGIVMHKTDELPEGTETAGFRGSVAPLYRLMLVRALGDRYRRILYLDCDMFVEGGDINRLLEVDIGSHPVGMVLDAPFFYEADHRALEFVKADLPAMPYANTGMQLIETKAYLDQDVDRRSFEVCKTHPHAIVLTDQSLTNLALRGKFAQLAPCWNWQLNGRYPLIPMRYPVFLRHFVSKVKPDRDPKGWHEARFNAAYRHFLTQLMPELLPKLSAASNPAPMTLSEASRLVLRHIRGRHFVADIIARHPDPYRAKV